MEDISQDAKRGQTMNLVIRDTDPKFRKYNPEWPTNDGRYLGICDGRDPEGFRGETIQIGVKRRSRGGEHKTIEVTPRLVQRLVVDEQLWARCYQAWLMRHEGHSQREIHKATHLYKSEKSYAHFFKNRIYTGDYEHGGVLYENFVPALIPPAWYEEEQKRRQDHGKKRKGEEVPPELEPRRVSSPNLLSGKAACESVPGQRHPMHAHRSPATKHRTAWNAYECPVHKHTHGEECPYYGVSQEAADKAVVDTILRNIITHENLRPLVDTLNSHLSSFQTTYTAEIGHLQTQIADAERQRRKYAKLIEDDDDPSPTLVAELKKHEWNKASLLEQKRQLEANGPTSVGTEPISDAMLDAYIEQVRQVMLGADPLLARRILDKFVDSVIFKKGTSMGTLYCTFPSDIFSPHLSPLQIPSLEGLG